MKSARVGSATFASDNFSQCRGCQSVISIGSGSATRRKPDVTAVLDCLQIADDPHVVYKKGSEIMNGLVAKALIRTRPEA